MIISDEKYPALKKLDHRTRGAVLWHAEVTAVQLAELDPKWFAVLSPGNLKVWVSQILPAYIWMAEDLWNWEADYIRENFEDISDEEIHAIQHLHKEIHQKLERGR